MSKNSLRTGASLDRNEYIRGTPYGVKKDVSDIFGTLVLVRWKEKPNGANDEPERPVRPSLRRKSGAGT